MQGTESRSSSVCHPASGDRIAISAYRTAMAVWGIARCSSHRCGIAGCGNAGRVQTPRGVRPTRADLQLEPNQGRRPSTSRVRFHQVPSQRYAVHRSGIKLMEKMVLIARLERGETVRECQIRSWFKNERKEAVGYSARENLTPKSSPTSPIRRSNGGGRLRKSFYFLFFKDFTSPGGSRTHGLFRLAFHPLTPPKAA